jgi:hypothetical protein
MSFSQVPWLLLCGGLTAIGLIASWIAYRRSGARAAMRGVAWSLLPIALYLVGILQVLWRFGVAIGDFFSGLAFSPKVWSGIIIACLSVLLFFITGGLRGRDRRKRAREKKQDGDAGPGQLMASSGTAASARAQPAAVPAKRKAAKPPAGDEDFDEVAQILKRHGIS